MACWVSERVCFQQQWVYHEKWTSNRIIGLFSITLCAKCKWQLYTFSIVLGQYICVYWQSQSRHIFRDFIWWKEHRYALRGSQEHGTVGEIVHNTRNISVKQFQHQTLTWKPIQSQIITYLSRSSVFCLLHFPPIVPDNVCSFYITESMYICRNRMKTVVSTSAKQELDWVCVSVCAGGTEKPINKIICDRWNHLWKWLLRAWSFNRVVGLLHTFAADICMNVDYE